MKRPGISNLRYLLLAGVAAALVVCGFFLFAPSRTPRDIEPNIEALKQILERRAEEALPLPSVSDDRIALRIEPSRFESEVERIVDIATELGGTAFQGGDDEILAQIPIENVLEFHARVTGIEPPETHVDQKSGENTQFIVVQLRQRASSASSARTKSSP